MILSFVITYIIFKVEVWLMRLLNAMVSTILNEMNESVQTYEDKPRDQWLFDFPAQVALCGTQIWWTTEVNQNFARLEEGYENALKDYSKKQVFCPAIIQTNKRITIRTTFLVRTCKQIIDLDETCKICFKKCYSVNVKGYEDYMTFFFYNYLRNQCLSPLRL
jgi:hypothetical protein